MRVTLRYDAPVYVTVNTETGDVERVYMDDESVTLATDDHTYVDPDGSEVPVERDTATVNLAVQIAETVDWTSTEGRCSVWRGVDGGPAGADQTLLDALDRLIQVDGPAGVVPFGELVAVRRWLTEQDLGLDR